MKELYIELSTLISNITGIKWVDIWSNQISNLAQELPFPTPAVFLEFASDEMSDIAQDGQLMNMQIDVILLVETFANSFHGSTSQSQALAFMDLLESIHANLHGSKGEYYGRMERISIRPESLGTAQIAYRMVYECLIVDESAAKTFEEVTSELDIQKGEIAESDETNTFDYE